MQWVRVRVRVTVCVSCAFSEAFVGIAAVGIGSVGIGTCTLNIVHTPIRSGRPKKCAQCAQCAQCEPPLLVLENGQDHQVVAQCTCHEAPTVSPTSPTMCSISAPASASNKNLLNTQSKLHGIAAVVMLNGEVPSGGQGCRHGFRKS